jgi:hypothetical protein
MKKSFIPLIIIAIIAIVSLIVMLLWNTLVPAIFSGPALSYLQAVGLLILAKILLFGGPGFRGSHDFRRLSRVNKFDVMLKHMTEDEKDALRAKLDVKA